MWEVVSVIHWLLEECSRGSGHVVYSCIILFWILAFAASSLFDLVVIYVILCFSDPIIVWHVITPI